MRRTMALFLAALIGTSASALAATTLSETGSSLIYPLFSHWADDYQHAHGDVVVKTEGTGSAMGISQAIQGVVQIGASDAYMLDPAMRDNQMYNIPLAISAQMVNYNVPGLNSAHINLSGPVLASIYAGDVKFWDDAKMKADNRALNLPHHEIIPIHRSDGSGDTFIFTQFLSSSTPSWKSGAGFDTTINWPTVANAMGAARNSGMVQACQATPFSIAYIGVSYWDQATKAGLGYAALKNVAGKFVLPTEENISAAADTLTKQTPADERVSLIFAAGAKSYPIVNYEYAIVNPKQVDGPTASELKKFLNWTLADGQNPKYLKPVHFLPLPSAVIKLSRAQIEKIQ